MLVRSVRSRVQTGPVRSGSVSGLGSILALISVWISPDQSNRLVLCTCTCIFRCENVSAESFSDEQIFGRKNVRSKKIRPENFWPKILGRNILAEKISAENFCAENARADGQASLHVENAQAEGRASLHVENARADGRASLHVVVFVFVFVLIGPTRPPVNCNPPLQNG